MRFRRGEVSHREADVENGVEMTNKNEDGGAHRNGGTAPRRGRRKFPVLLTRLVLLLIIWAICRNSFVVVRKGYVQLHYWIAPKAATLLSSSAWSLRDLSEGEIYKHLPASVSFPTPGVQQGGCAWDVGANNGVWHSNSHYLIHALKFHAWLFEPDAATFLQLRQSYAEHPRVKLHNFALAETTGIQTLRLFPMGFENTIRAKKNNQADAMEYSYDIAVQDASLLCKQQQEALATGLCAVTNVEDGTNLSGYTVLSVDAEGSDWEVFLAAHRLGCHWDLVILEGRGDAKKTAAMGYEVVLHLAYNYVFAYRGGGDGALDNAARLRNKS